MGESKWRLRRFHELPKHLQTNQFLLGSYRPLTDWRGSLRSIAYLHNETVNIVTHGTN